MPIGALIGAAGIGAGGAVIASNNGKKAANTATAAATQSASDNNALQRDIYNQNKTALTPFINQGAQYTGKINDLLATNPFNYDPGKFQESPDYQFRLQQGNDNVQQQNAATNTRLSGSAQKALASYNSNMAAGEYTNWWNRDQSRISGENNVQNAYLNALTGQQQVGSGAANALAGVGTNYANQTSANNQFAANQVGNAALANGANQGNLINGLASSTSNLLGQWQAGRGSSYGSSQVSGMDAAGVKMNLWGLN